MITNLYRFITDRLISRPPDRDQLAKQAARCFSGADGQAVLTHLARYIFAGQVSDNLTDRQLQAKNGQRLLYLHLLTLIKQGKE
jgi:hypothetical protein